ncbi:hypothetical protein [Caballeronia choica]|uniref:hypothetical protein n=1 Tax=Caballeronia choica TaxID=326476 RepID=UPI000F744B88|nr:hypothetical protein [Caballeronia choica]
MHDPPPVKLKGHSEFLLRRISGAKVRHDETSRQRIGGKLNLTIRENTGDKLKSPSVGVVNELRTMKWPSSPYRTFRMLSIVHVCASATGIELDPIDRRHTQLRRASAM